ncbi:MAG: sulfur oxidation protein SoxY [Azospirillum sp.]|nr:sulfur oxidation protein SoxY [Azospirillum sp.]
MAAGSRTSSLTRRGVLAAAWSRGAGLAGVVLAGAAPAGRGQAGDDTIDAAVNWVERVTGQVPTRSERVHLTMPAHFPNGYTVPMTVAVESPMTPDDYVRAIRIFAPKNPIVEVVGFRFTPDSGRARVATRIRLSEPQDVIAVAELGDGTVLLASSPVAVDVNGCT